MPVDPTLVAKRTKQTTGHQKGLLAALNALPSLPPPLPPVMKPRATWQRQLLGEFTALRNRVPRLGNAASASSTSTPSALPDAHDVQGWEAWCGLSGRGGSSSGKYIGNTRAHSQSDALAPTLRKLRLLDQNRVVGLLCALHLLFQRCVAHGTNGCAPGVNDAMSSATSAGAASAESTGNGVIGLDALCQWAFSALVHLDDDRMLDADVCAAVRGMFSASVVMRAQLLMGWQRDTDAISTAEGKGTQASELNERQRRLVAALNVLVTICGGHFKQASQDEWEGVQLHPRIGPGRDACLYLYLCSGQKRNLRPGRVAWTVDRAVVERKCHDRVHSGGGGVT